MSTPIQQFFKEHGISEVEAVVPDMAGIARGKVMPAMKFAEDEGMRMPESIFLQTVTGEYPEDDRAISPSEIDIVLNRSAFLAGDLARAFDDIAASKLACGAAHLKVILEAGELGTYDNVRRASMLAMAAGGDFIKTSTGKIGVNATPPFALLMSEAIRDHFEQTGVKVGLKLAGGIRTAKQSWQYLVIVNETLGPDWLTPHLFRLGASSLLNDVLMQLRMQATGLYQRPDDFTVD